MFASFFPRPLAFAVSAILWGIFAIGLWCTFGPQFGELLGFHIQDPGAKLVGASVFWSPQFLWFYLNFSIAVGLFATAWMILSPHPWSHWSIFGSALILFTSYFQVQVSVAINDWYGPFYDLVQAALSKSAPSTASILPSARNVCRNCICRSDSRRFDQVLCQPLHLSLAYCDERILRRVLVAASNR